MNKTPINEKDNKLFTVPLQSTWTKTLKSMFKLITRNKHQIKLLILQKEWGWHWLFLNEDELKKKAQAGELDDHWIGGQNNRYVAEPDVVVKQRQKG